MKESMTTESDTAYTRSFPCSGRQSKYEFLAIKDNKKLYRILIYT